MQGAVWRRASLGALGGLGAALSVAVMAGLLYADSRSVEGLYVDGVAVPRTSSPEGLLRAQADRWLEAPITLDAGPVVVSHRRSALGARIPMERASARVREVGRTSWLPADLATRWRVARDGMRLGWPVHVERERLFEQLRTLRRRLEQRARPDVELSLNVVQAAERVSDALRNGRVYVELPVLRTSVAAPPDLDPGSATFDVVLGRYESDYPRAASPGRRANIRRAAMLIDHRVIPPGGTFSFNETLGERTLERGFRPSSELAGGEVVEGIGGGICQVAGTLYAAAFFADLPVPERHVHSRLSRHVELGLGAMVSWPEHDLRIHNDYPFPLRIRSGAREGNLWVELRGSYRLREVVDWHAEVVAQLRYGETVEPAPELAPGAREVVYEGEQGRVVRVVREVRSLRREEDSVRRSEQELRYPPVDRRVRVGGASVPPRDEGGGTR